MVMVKKSRVPKSRSPNRLHFTFEQIINKAMIRLEKINKTYFGAQPMHVLKGIDLEVAEGEMVSTIGDRGSGQSTF